MNGNMGFFSIVPFPLVEYKDDFDQAYLCDMCNKQRTYIYDPFCSSECMREYYKDRLPSFVLDVMVLELQKKRGDLAQIIEKQDK